MQQLYRPYPPPVVGATAPPGTPPSNSAIVVGQSAMFAVGAGFGVVAALAVFAFTGPKHR